jgi:hypothetical protein
LISAELAGIFERLNWSAESWQKRRNALNDDRLQGRLLAPNRAKLPEIDNSIGVSHPCELFVLSGALTAIPIADCSESGPVHLTALEQKCNRPSPKPHNDCAQVGAMRANPSRIPLGFALTPARLGA